MSTSHKKHDVFISFRGEDTRVNFTSHLYDALKKRNIETYTDIKLERGDDNIWSVIDKAITDSVVSLVVFSENYANSKWCLEELLRILECRKLQGQVVIPIFYKIDPSHVGHQTKSYEKAFAKYERDSRSNGSLTERVSEWKVALEYAAKISGWDSNTFR
jgi:hypothetical protein